MFWSPFLRTCYYGVMDISVSITTQHYYFLKLLEHQYPTLPPPPLRLCQYPNPTMLLLGMSICKRIRVKTITIILTVFVCQFGYSTIRPTVYQNMARVIECRKRDGNRCGINQPFPHVSSMLSITLHNANITLKPPQK